MVDRKRLLALCAGTLAVAFAGLPAHGQAPVKVGENFAIRIDSSDTSVSDVESIDPVAGHVYEIHHPGATYIAIHFEKFDLIPGDFVVVSDPLGGQSYMLEGKGKMEAGTFWSQHIKGDTAVVELVGRNPRGAKGFVIDEYAAGTTSLDPVIEAICGIDDKDNAVCYQSSHPTEYDRGRAVARLLINGSGLCTGWLVSGDDHLLTNEHCITSATDALNTDYEFMAEAPNCSDINCQLCYPGAVFSGGTFIQDDAGLDYCLVQVTSGNPAATYGHIEIDDRVAVPGEEIYILQYPGGRAKEFGIYSTDASDAGGICSVYSITEPPCAGSGYYDVGYFCDTEGGSSGSPVLARSSHKAIALHHCALCPNRGVPINLVYAEISSFLGPECTVNGDCDDANACTIDTCVSESCVHDPIADCCGNGTCESGEDCYNCSGDCFAGTGAVCGNNICETADGEDCRSCSADCNGVLGGRPSGRYCCGDSVTCTDSRCTGDGNTCSSTPSVGSCCGDGTCEGSEDDTNCAIDCGVVGCLVNEDCDDSDACTDDVCSGGVCSNTPIDCGDGDACTTDYCSGGSCFNDPITCDDSDPCTTDSCDSVSGCVYQEVPCQDGDGCCPTGCDSTNDDDCDSCVPDGGYCTTGADCCSGSCHPAKDYCR